MIHADEDEPGLYHTSHVHHLRNSRNNPSRPTRHRLSSFLTFCNLLSLSGLQSPEPDTDSEATVRGLRTQEHCVQALALFPNYRWECQ